MCSARLLMLTHPDCCSGVTWQHDSAVNYSMIYRSYNHSDAPKLRADRRYIIFPSVCDNANRTHLQLFFPTSEVPLWRLTGWLKLRQARNLTSTNNHTTVQRRHYVQHFSPARQPLQRTVPCSPDDTELIQNTKTRRTIRASHINQETRARVENFEKKNVCGCLVKTLTLR